MASLLYFMTVVEESKDVEYAYTIIYVEQNNTPWQKPQVMVEAWLPED